MAPTEPAVDTQPVYQPVCPYGHPLCYDNMCGYSDCPNSYCYVGNTYNNAGTNYDYSGGNCYQGGNGYQGGYGGGHHGGGHHGHGCY
ncbi:hypothetical protein [Schaedlerella sp.]|uniref:hypothetical protein n=1 Tax=Schaedlerella sp. TaxID=2676057 RepID=UPI00352936FC